MPLRKSSVPYSSGCLGFAATPYLSRPQAIRYLFPCSSLQILLSFSTLISKYFIQEVILAYLVFSDYILHFHSKLFHISEFFPCFVLLYIFRPAFSYNSGLRSLLYLRPFNPKPLLPFQWTLPCCAWSHTEPSCPLVIPNRRWSQSSPPWQKCSSVSPLPQS